MKVELIAVTWLDGCDVANAIFAVGTRNLLLDNLAHPSRRAAGIVVHKYDVKCRRIICS